MLADIPHIKWQNMVSNEVWSRAGQDSIDCHIKGESRAGLAILLENLLPALFGMPLDGNHKGKRKGQER